MNDGDLGQSGSGLRNLLGLLDDLLGISLNLLLLLLNDLGQFLNSLLKGFLNLSLLDSLSVLYFFVHFLGSLRGDSDLSILGLLLDSNCLFLKSLDSVIQGGDLGVDGNIFLFILLKLGVLSLDISLDGFNFSFEVGDFVLDLSLFLLLLGDDSLVLKLRDLMRVLSHSVGVLFDVSLLLDNSVSNKSLLSIVLSGLLTNSLLGLLSGMLVSDGILSNGDSSVLMLMSVISSAHSVDASSLNFLVLLQGVVRSSLSGSVLGIVSLPLFLDLGQGRSVSSNQSGNISNVLLILLDFTLDRLNFSLNNLLLFLLDLLNSLLEDLESRGKILLLSGVGGD